MTPLSLEEYAAAVTAIIEGGAAPADQVKEIAALKRRLVKNPDLVPADFHEGLEDVAYTRNLLYADPEGRFTVMAIVWGPGRGSPVHDHQTWGVVGVVDNDISITDYGAPGDDGRLEERSASSAHPGDVLCILPPREHNIHRMSNAGERPCVTIHTYGDPARTCRVFDVKSGRASDCELTFHHAL